MGTVPRHGWEARQLKQESLRFVVQEHHASHLHYDFQLEVGRVLKSSAIPKGPSMNPIDKRLAVLVEDHPLDYTAFEGIIPEGKYGAGAVVIWGAGNFTPLEDLKTGLRKGRLSFFLMGKRLGGEFALVLLKRSKTGKEWLLIKKKDAFADPSWKLEKALTLAGQKSLKVLVPPCDTA